MSNAPTVPRAGTNEPGLAQVRCPQCNRLACEAARGSRLRVKCVRCGHVYERQV